MDKEHRPPTEGGRSEAVERRQREQELIARLIEATRNDEDVVGWNQRLAKKAKEIGVPLENVAWNDTPQAVATRIMQLALVLRKLEEVEKIVEGSVEEK